MIILPTADVDAAHARAEQIRLQLRILTVLHQGRPLGTVTTSVGVAAFPLHGTTPQLLLDAADAALYSAKAEGRDRVIDAPPLETIASNEWRVIPSQKKRPTFKGWASNRCGTVCDSCCSRR